MARAEINGRKLTVREAIFLATSGSIKSIAYEGQSADRETLTTDEVRAVRDILRASRSRDLNLDTALTEANDELRFRTENGY